MACDLTLWNASTKTKKVVVCDEETAGKIVQDDHAAKGTSHYADAAGATFDVDWVAWRLVRFNRRHA
jgi:hypothetical protein